MKVVVGTGPCSPRSAAAATPASKRLRMTQVPPRSSVPPANRTETEWYMGEHTRWTSSGPNDHRSASSSKAASAVAASHRPDHTPFDRPVVPEV